MSSMTCGLRGAESAGWGMTGVRAEPLLFIRTARGGVTGSTMEESCGVLGSCHASEEAVVEAGPDSLGSTLLARQPLSVLSQSALAVERSRQGTSGVRGFSGRRSHVVRVRAVTGSRSQLRLVSPRIAAGAANTGRPPDCVCAGRPVLLPLVFARKHTELLAGLSAPIAASGRTMWLLGGAEAACRALLASAAAPGLSSRGKLGTETSSGPSGDEAWPFELCARGLSSHSCNGMSRCSEASCCSGEPGSIAASSSEAPRDCATTLLKADALPAKCG